MLKKILFPVVLFLSLVPIFVLQKPIFMLVNKGNLPLCLSDYVEVIWHGVSLDLTMAGYFAVLPMLLVMISLLIPLPFLHKILRYYLLLVCVAVGVIFSVDLELYSFWGFRLDATPLFYLSNPKLAFASVDTWIVVRQFLIMALFAFLTFLWLKKTILRFDALTIKANPFLTMPLLILMSGGLFVVIRGGLSASTANVGQVYYSPNMFLNHSAINPTFCFLASVIEQEDFGKMYQYLPEEERAALFDQMIEHHDSSPASSNRPLASDSIPHLLKNKRPDIYLIILESFSAGAIEPLGGRPGVTPRLNQAAREGVLFTNFYSNTFRTDRGLAAVLNGYPAQPNTSIMKYPAKSQTLPAIARQLNGAGYRSDVLYGGDINFTNMLSFFRSSGFERVTCDKDFSAEERLSRWGVGDGFTFRKLWEQVEQYDGKQPLFHTFLTLSSHEPFDVPYKKFDDPYFNSIAYTDSCLGDFLDKLKASPRWDKSLVIFVADHGFKYEESLDNYSPKRFQIPLIWTGGAVSSPRVIDHYGSQIDLAATLLEQLGLDHQMFAFSKSLVNPHVPHFAYISFVNGFGILDQQSKLIFDADVNEVRFFESVKSLDQQPQEKELYLKKAQSFVQSIFQDLDRR